jgi:hypothetical protein
MKISLTLFILLMSKYGKMVGGGGGGQNNGNIMKLRNTGLFVSATPKDLLKHRIFYFCLLVQQQKYTMGYKESTKLKLNSMV